MVARLFTTLIALLLFSFPLFGERVVVTAQVEGKIYEGMQVTGSITVTHDEASSVDTASFLLGDKPLEVIYDKEVKIDPRSRLTISIYHFTLEPQTVGLHELPEISVTVGGTVYRSIASTFEVEKPPPAPTAPKQAPPPAPKKAPP